jgi:hypothetical protein
MHSKQDYKPYFQALTKPTKLKVQKSKLRQTRFATFACAPAENNSSYYFPKKESLKFIKKLIFEISSDTGEVVPNMMKYMKHTKPNKFVISSQSIYKFYDKIEMFKHLDFFSALNGLALRIEGALFYEKTAHLLMNWLYKSPNLKSLSVSIEKGSVIAESLAMFMSSFEGLQKLETLIFKTPSTDLTDHEIKQLAGNTITTLDKLKNLIIEINSNRNLTNDGVQALGESLKSKSLLEKFELNILGTTVGKEGLESLMKSLDDKKKLKKLVLRVNEVPEFSDVLAEFLKKHEGVASLALDFANSSKINGEGLRELQETVATMPALKQYILNMNGCHALKGAGTYYLSDCIGLFGHLKELKVYFTSFLETWESGDKCLDYLEESVAKLTKLEFLHLDFNGCTDWFVEVRSRDNTFLEKIGHLQKLTKLALNLRKTFIDSNHLQKLQNAVLGLKGLKSFELDLSFCKYIDEKDVRSMLLILPTTLELEELNINADDVRYSQTHLAQDVQNVIRGSKSLKTMALSFRKTLTKKEGLNLIAAMEKLFPFFTLNITGGRAFTVVKPPSFGSAHNPNKRSAFGRG